MLPEELLQQIKQIHIYTSHLVNDVMAGEYASAFKGKGMEFQEVREYHPGDDVRSIDWNVTAKMGHPFVKEFREERELTLFLMVDMSASGRFGSHQKLKIEVAAEVAALLAYTASRNNDKLGMLLFTTDVEDYIPPKKGRAHVWRVIQKILAFAPSQSGTDLAKALDFAGNLIRKKTVLFLISDFLDSHYEKPLLLASKHHDLVAIRIVDPREGELPAAGLLELEDAETQEVRLIDTSSPRTREYFKREAARRQEETTHLLRRAGVDQIEISTDRSYVAPLVQYFRRRERKKR